MDEGRKLINKYKVELDSLIFMLDEAQYKAYLRKKDMPVDRLKIWLNSYQEENQ